ncbi:non-ribosomal peptide synthetase [Nocardiopsis sp. LDBS1602]|uniref:non-ribosomal peptide synthetase n=1 Tax=Nocardiopsis sp. LDBS1602 TaxID=3109597 RepID=UPI002DBD7725|nr:amino acid adenylation domain-containing protein [Nocardiopsis sp. LDBS1602]MEC3893360.1 amino acid adenylation domain-containing protein [Nocardiopsis sp. LDBS1602]
MIDTENIESVSGLAAMQKGMFFSYAVDTGSDAYVEQFDFTGTGDVDADRLREALVATSRHYSVLRTVFSFERTDDPYQLVLKEWPPRFEVIDHRDREDAAQAVEEFKAADRARGFDLGADVLLRAALLRTGDGHWHLVVTFHHIILDGWSLAPLFQTWFGYYDELVRTGSLTQRYEDRPYSDYVSWYEDRHDEDEARRFWTEALDGYERPASLPRDRRGAPSSVPERSADYVDATHRFELPRHLHDGLVSLARRLSVTPNSVFQTVWGVVLQKFTYTDDVVFGSVVSGRNADMDGIEEMLGLFTNTRPVRVTAGEDTGFADLCRAVHADSLRASGHEHFPLHEVQSLSPLRNALLNHVIAFENYPLSERLRDFGAGEDGGPRLHGVEVFERTDYDFNIVVTPGARLGVAFLYNAAVHSDGLMETLERCLVAVLSAVVRDADVRVRDIGMWEPEPRVSEPAPTGAGRIPIDSSLVEVFGEVVRTHADRTAMVWRGTEYTYRTLDRWSDAVARTLIDRGVGGGTGIGVLADRRPELVVALLAILKTGNHYVPVDVKDAPVRIETVLADAGVRHLCTVADFTDLVPSSVEALLVEGPGEDTGRDAPEPPRISGEDRAYLMYTSGSTGVPKGCYITHRNVLRLFADQEFVDFREEQSILFVNSPAFDGSTLEVWGALLSGGTLVLPDDELDLLDADRFRDTIVRHGVRNVTIPTVLFNQHGDHDPKIFAPLRYLCVVGSALSVRHVAKVAQACPDVKLVNGYGPTENTVFSTTHTIRPEDLEGARVPIGRAIAHSTAHVLDNGLNPLPPGAVGELCVGGEGVSTGYHDRPDLNRERFVSLARIPGERLYRTGDLVRELPDGTLDCLGRMDDQVKVGGFRVELGEVENALCSVEGVKEAVVTTVELEHGTRLAGYYVADGELTPDRVQRELGTKVAGYMIPASVTRIEAVPINRNGKVDKEGLESSRLRAVADRARRDPGPAHGTERILHEIVADVLEVDSGDVDVERNFFDLGVTSLTLLAIRNRLRAKADRDLPLTLFFEFTSISALAEHLDSGSVAGPSVDEEPEDEPEQEQAVRTQLLMARMMDDSEGGVDDVRRD